MNPKNHKKDAKKKNMLAMDLGNYGREKLGCG
jgi:hypothetical protein